MGEGLCGKIKRVFLLNPSRVSLAGKYGAGAKYHPFRLEKNTLSRFYSVSCIPTGKVYNIQEAQIIKLPYLF
jgi:hypothetical protein